ncbi:MAG: ACT domain-containing protein [Planctomycetes bacterium]|nr:ACT domain-containing protein [Planctomycetota bacterium]
MHSLALASIPGTFAVCKLAPDSGVPVWAATGPFFSITRTPGELSIVCHEADVPADVSCERGWRGLRVKGKLDFSVTGVLSSLVDPLAEAGISVFALSTFDTDYLLVKAANFDRALNSLREAGHILE